MSANADSADVSGRAENQIPLDEAVVKPPVSKWI